MSVRLFLKILLAALIAGAPSWCQAKFAFSVTSDQRFYTGSFLYNGSNYFKGTLEALRLRGAGDFMVNVGDMDPVPGTHWTVGQVLGEEFPWIPVVGNHELPGEGFELYDGANLIEIRNQLQFLIDSHFLTNVRQGPSGCPVTTFSFDYHNVHLVIVNEYCDSGGDSVSNGDIPDHLYDWLLSDLSGTGQEHIFVFGHEPAYPVPDMDTGRLRNEGSCLNAFPGHRDRFWSLLRNHRVKAYFCGHSHDFSVRFINGVWQLNSGHARGLGDLSSPSTFLVVEVDGPDVFWRTYRDNHDGVYDYDDILHSGVLRTILPPLLHMLLRKTSQATD